MKTDENLWDADIESLRAEAGAAGDLAMVGICEVALHGECDFDEFTALDANDRSVVSSYTRESARRFVCIMLKLNAAAAEAQ